MKTPADFSIRLDEAPGDWSSNLGTNRGTLLKWQSNYCSIWHGAIAQLGERVVRNDEAVGSIPTSSTNLLNYLPT